MFSLSSRERERAHARQLRCLSRPNKQWANSHRIEKLQRIPQQPLFIPQDRHLPPPSDGIQPGRTAGQQFFPPSQARARVPDPRLRVGEGREEGRVQGQGIGVGLVVRPDGAGERGGEGSVDLEEGLKGVA